MGMMDALVEAKAAKREDVVVFLLRLSLEMRFRTRMMLTRSLFLAGGYSRGHSSQSVEVDSTQLQTELKQIDGKLN